jgi:hypothetical protein
MRGSCQAGGFIFLSQPMNIVTKEESTTSTAVQIEDPSKSKQTKMSDDDFLPNSLNDRIDVGRVRYPHCLVWTPIPVLSWLFPFIGHMGIARTDGVIRDFAGPYYVSVSRKKFLFFFE